MTYKQRRLLKTVRFKRGKVGGIYCWKNMVNGKELIGQTKHFPTRKKQYNQKGGNSLFNKDVKKYGWNNFKVFCLNTATNPDIRNRLETFYILRRNSLTPNGYNQNTGGDCYEVTDGFKENVKNACYKSTKWLHHQYFQKEKRKMNICTVCGKIFYPKGKHKKRRKLCSIECSIKWEQSDEGRKIYTEYGKLGGRPLINRETRLCTRCNNTFLARPKEYRKKCDECLKKSKE